MTFAKRDKRGRERGGTQGAVAHVIVTMYWPGKVGSWGKGRDAGEDSRRVTAKRALILRNSGRSPPGGGSGGGAGW